MKFRKKTEVIEAVPVPGVLTKPGNEMPAWISTGVLNGQLRALGGELLVQTLEAAR